MYIRLSFQKEWFIKVPIAANKKEFVYKIKVNPIHTILNMVITMNLCIGNDAVLKSSSQWQLKEC